MIAMATSLNQRATDVPLVQPRSGGSVWPAQHCPAFSPRSTALAAGKECWFCTFADFHILERVPLDVGICCWPKVRIE